MSDSLAARWEQYHEAGRRSFGQGQLAEAEQAFNAAVGEAELLGPESPQLATSLNALGQIRTQLKDYPAAEPLLARALAIREKAFGTEGHELVPTLNALAALHDGKAEYDRAESLLRRALGISEHHLGPAHPEVSVGLNNLAKLYFKRRDFAKADRLLLRLLEIKRGLGKDHPEVATVLGSLAKLRQTVGKHDQGEQLWRQALAIRERCFAPNDPVIATTLENTADCCAPVPGRLAEAIALRERALSIREQATNANLPALASARAKLDELRSRSDTPGVTSEPPPRRSSKEIPSPFVVNELPAHLRDDLPRQRPSDLPWIDDEVPDRISGQMGVMNSPPHPTRSRTPSASVTPVGVPRQSGAHLPTAFVPPITPGGDLMLSDSIAPEPPQRASTSGRAPRYVAPPEPRNTASGRGARYVAPDPDATVDARPRTPRMPAEMSRRGSSKRLVIVGVVLMLLAGAGWTQRNRFDAGRLPFVDTVVGATAPKGESVPAAAPALNQPDSRVSARPDSLVQPTTALVRDISAGTARFADSLAREAAASLQKKAQSEPAVTAPVHEEKRLPARDSTAKARRADADALHLKDVSVVGGATDIDAVTSGIEQSTKSKIESAQKSAIDVKPPVFKKP
jgi:tetratricopeptide (TPR) repeat protein